MSRTPARLAGVHTILWLATGIVGDDTDGHVDDRAGSSRDGIVTAVERNRRDKNFPISG